MFTYRTCLYNYTRPAPCCSSTSLVMRASEIGCAPLSLCPHSRRMQSVPGSTGSSHLWSPTRGGTARARPFSAAKYAPILRMKESDHKPPASSTPFSTPPGTSQLSSAVAEKSLSAVAEKSFNSYFQYVLDLSPHPSRLTTSTSQQYPWVTLRPLPSSCRFRVCCRAENRHTRTCMQTHL
jgi:hypothetical protein